MSIIAAQTVYLEKLKALFILIFQLLKNVQKLFRNGNA